MSMKHLLTCVLAFTCWSAQAQFVGTRSLFLMSNLLDNPAAAGNSPCLDMRMGVRSQWAGFEGAPLTSFASLSGRLGQGTTLAHGMGGYVMTDAIGPWSNTRFSLAYSTKIRLTTGGRLSAGIGLGMVQYRLDVGSLQFPEVVATDDPALLAQRLRKRCSRRWILVVVRGQTQFRGIQHSKCHGDHIDRHRCHHIFGGRRC